MEKAKALRVYLLSQPLLDTEWPALLGHKYHQALPFTVEITDDIAQAQVIAWDGVVTLKMRLLKEELLEHLKTKKIILMGEARTLFANHPLVELQDFANLDVVEVSGWTVLPEELLIALEACYQKLAHV